MKLDLVLTIVALAACTSHYSNGDLVGEYALSVDEGVDTITLSANRTYIHSYRTKTGAMAQQDGTWALENLQAGPTLVLSNFRPLFGEKVRGQSTHLLLVKRSFGDVHLITNIDLNEGYKRLKRNGSD